METYFTLKLLAQLTFNPSIAIDLLNYRPIISILDSFDEKNISKTENSNDKFVFENILSEIQKIKWNLSLIKRNIVVDDGLNEQHIMISYNSASRETCLKVKEKLNSMGYKVWIDVNGT